MSGRAKKPRSLQATIALVVCVLLGALVWLGVRGDGGAGFGLGPVPGPVVTESGVAAPSHGPAKADNPAKDGSPIPVGEDASNTASADVALDAVQGSEAWDAVPDALEAQPYVLPEGTAYEPEVVLVTPATGVSTDEARDQLLQMEGVQGVQETAGGMLELQLAEGADVAAAVNDLLAESDVADAQPNFIYYPMLGDESDLRAELAATDDVAQEAVGEPSADLPANEDAVATDGQVPGDFDTEAPASDDGETPELVADAVEADDLLSEEALPAADDTAGDAPADTSDDPLELVPEAAKVEVDDPRVSNQWALSSINAYEAWAIARCEGKVTVAVLDTGFDVSHDDLAANIVSPYNAFNDRTKSGSTTDVTPVKGSNHGTHVAGVICAVANNKTGVAGISYNAHLMPIRTANKEGTFSTLDLVGAYEYLRAHASEHKVRVVNLSMGVATTKTDTAFVKQVNAARKEGIVTVASAGNATSSYPAPYAIFPGDLGQVVSVMSLTMSKTRASNSNYNAAGEAKKNISAPGSNILSTIPGGYGYLSGTSMSAPCVSAILALEFAANPKLTALEAEKILYGTAEDLGAEGFDEEYGWGAVDAAAAVKAARDGQVPELNGGSMAPAPVLTCPDSLPVGARATVSVTNGTVEIKQGSAASLSSGVLSGLSAGTVTLSVLDANGDERSTKQVEVYATSGCWTISSALNEAFVLDLSGGSLDNKGNIQLYKANGTRAQAWLLQLQTDGSFVVRSAKTGKVLDVSGGSKADKANVQQYASNGTDAQRWLMTVDAQGMITLINKKSGKALEASGNVAANKRNVWQYAKSEVKGQKWVLNATSAHVGPVWDGVYKIGSRINGAYVLDVSGASKKNGANVQLYRSNGTNAQKWKIEWLEGDVYRITNVASGRVLDVSGGKKANRTNIQQWGWNGTGAQRWRLVAAAGGSYTLRREGTSFVIDVSGGVAANRRNVQQYQGNSTKAQQWTLTQY